MCVPYFFATFSISSDLMGCGRTREGIVQKISAIPVVKYISDKCLFPETTGQILFFLNW